jgi:prepilin-type N-terminal cleavage/methylation domain-containing protein
MSSFLSCRPMTYRNRGGFTLVELLVVISIIGILIGLLLPAVNAARESGRRTQCGNNMRQLGMGAQHHLETLSFYPSGGWGGDWIGDPTRGFDWKQPGGWCYNLLPFVEQEALHDLGSTEPNFDKRKPLLTAITQQPLVMFLCPTRRRASLYPFQQRSFYNTVSPVPELCNKSDYAACVGTHGPCEADGLFQSYADADSKGPPVGVPANDGVTYCRSMVRSVKIVDGETNTILYGEKLHDSAHYTTGDTACDNHTMMLGFDNDICRTTASTAPVMQDSSRLWSNEIPNGQTYLQCCFGSAHPAGCMFVFCDSSVHLIKFSIDATTFANLGQMNDREPIDASKY